MTFIVVFFEDWAHTENERITETESAITKGESITISLESSSEKIALCSEVRMECSGRLDLKYLFL